MFVVRGKLVRGTGLLAGLALRETVLVALGLSVILGLGSILGLRVVLGPRAILGLR